MGHRRVPREEIHRRVSRALAEDHRQVPQVADRAQSRIRPADARPGLTDFSRRDGMFVHVDALQPSRRRRPVVGQGAPEQRGER